MATDNAGVFPGDVKPQRPLSLPAVLGFAFGLLSLVPFCCFIPNILAVILSSLGIVHTSGANPRRGRGLAVAGLVLALLGVVIGFAFSAKSFMSARDEAKAAHGNPSREQSPFRAADNKIDVYDGKTVAFGNSPEAIELAENYSALFATMEKLSFTKKSSKLSTSGGKMLTYCELHEDSVVFLVHVPQLRDYKKDVRDALATIAWEVGQTCTKDLSERTLGIGLRGAMLYGPVWIGKTTGQPAQQLSGSTSALEPFFAKTVATPPAESQPVATPTAS